MIFFIKRTVFCANFHGTVFFIKKTVFCASFHGMISSLYKMFFMRILAQIDKTSDMYYNL